MDVRRRDDDRQPVDVRLRRLGDVAFDPLRPQRLAGELGFPSAGDLPDRVRPGQDGFQTISTTIAKSRAELT